MKYIIYVALRKRKILSIYKFIFILQLRKRNAIIYIVLTKYTQRRRRIDKIKHRRV